MNASTSPLLLPVQVLRLVARNWGSLLVLFCVGYLLQEVLLRGGARLGHVNREAGLLVLSFTVLAKLVILTAMFHVLRRDLPTLTRLVHIRTDGYPDTAGEEEQRVVEVIGRVIMPFLILYGAWGLYVEDARAYANLGLSGDDLDLLVDVGFTTALTIVVVSLLLRIALERPFRRTGKPIFGIMVAFFESVWMFFALFSILEWSRAATAWVISRVAWAEAAEAGATAVRRIGAVFDGLGLSALPDLWWSVFGYLPALKDGLVLPLLWLTIAAIVYGRDMQVARGIVAGHQRLERTGGAVERMWGGTRGRAEWFTQGPRDKYVPLLNSLRLVLNAGPVLYLTFCVFYLGLDHATRWAWIGITRLLGPHDPAFWQIALVPVSFGTEAAHEVVRIALLAATFDLVLRRVSARNATPASTTTDPAPPAFRPVGAPPAG